MFAAGRAFVLTQGKKKTFGNSKVFQTVLT